MEILKHRFANLFVLRTNHDIYVYYIYILLLIMIMIMIMIVIKHATDGLYFWYKNIVDKSFIDYLSDIFNDL